MDVIVAGDSASSGGAFVSHDAAVFPAAEVVMAMMKQLLFAAIGIVVCGASAACAADMGPPVYKAPYPVPPPPPPLYSWTGFYVGGNGGFGGNNVTYSSTIAGVTGNTSLNSSGFLGGGQAGFNWQVAPSWVIGVETDFDGTNISSNASASTPFASANAGTKTDWCSSTEPAAGPMATPRRRPLPRLSGSQSRFQAPTCKTAGRRAADSNTPSIPGSRSRPSIFTSISVLRI
jgi:hypothetical protein